MKRVLAAVAFLAFLAAPPQPARGIEVNPGFLRKVLIPGKIDTVVINLKTDRPQEDVWIQPVDYQMDRRGAVSIEDRKDKRFSAKDWCLLKPSEVTVARGPAREFKVPMKVPSGTRAGEYYLGLHVYIPTSPPATQQAYSVKYEINFVVLVIVEVPGGGAQVGGAVEDPAVDLKGAIPFPRGTFHNKGTVSVIARMSAIIRGADREVVDHIQLDAAASQQADGQGFVLPDSLRDFEGEGNRKLPAGTYTAEIYVRFGEKKHRVRKSIEFTVPETPPPASPVDDVLVTPETVDLEIASGGFGTHVPTLKNRGIGAVDLVLATDHAGVSIFPDRVHLEPGQSAKIRVGIKMPTAAHPRRSLRIRAALAEGGEKDVKTIPIEVYAPGMAPRREGEEKPKEEPKPRGSEPHDHDHDK